MGRLREAEQMWVPGDDVWRRLSENVEHLAVILLDTKGRVVSWNRGAEKLNGYAAEEIIGRSFSVFYPVEATEVGHPQRELEAAAAIGRYAEEGWRVRKDGNALLGRGRNHGDLRRRR
jgi:PAS domain S-box-containing protein